MSCFWKGSIPNYSLRYRARGRGLRSRQGKGPLCEYPATGSEFMVGNHPISFVLRGCRSLRTLCLHRRPQPVLHYFVCYFLCYFGFLFCYFVLWFSVISVISFCYFCYFLALFFNRFLKRFFTDFGIIWVFFGRFFATFSTSRKMIHPTNVP